MSTKLTYTGAEVQELLDKIEKGDFDNAKTLEGHPASYFAIASEFTSLAESFATEQGRVDTLCGYFNNGSANDALSLGGQLPSYYATALQYEILQQTLTDFKSLFDSMFEKDSAGNIHAKLSLWSSGGITAGGVGSGGSGGGGISYNRLDSWSDYSADKAGYVLSALLGKDLDNRVSALTNAGYITTSALAPYALRSEIPSLVGYATQSWVGDNFLSKSGGKISGSERNLLSLDSSDPLGSIFSLCKNGEMLAAFGVLPSSYDSRFGSFWSNLEGNIAIVLGSDGKPYFTADANSLLPRFELLHSNNISNYVTNSYIKSTLGISDWALASAKPTYTASEVGALGVKDTAQQSYGLRHSTTPISDKGLHWWSGQFQVSTEPVSGKIYLGSSGDYTVISVPGIDGTSSLANACVLRLGYNRQFFHEIFTSPNSHNIYHRNVHVGNGNPWRQFAFTSDLPTKLSQLTDDVVAGKYLSLSGGTLSGSNRELLKLDTSNTSGPRITLNENGNLIALIGCVPKQTTTDYGAYFVNVSSKFGVILGNDRKAYITLNADTMSKDYQILHSGNYSDYALPLTGGIMAKNSYIDWGNTDGFEDYSAYSNGFKILGYNAGSGDYRGGIHVGVRYGWQLTRNAGSEVFQIRNYSPSSASWGDWKTIAFTSDIPTKLSQLTDDVVEGKYLSLAGGTVNGSITASSFIGNLTGNADSAGKLATPRTIWGQSFDGTQDVTGALTAPAITTNSLTIGGATITYDLVNEALCINGNMYALGGITAGGAGISAYTSLEARVARLEQQLNIS